jgi:putative glutamine amidotransferase
MFKVAIPARSNDQGRIERYYASAEFVAMAHASGITLVMMMGPQDVDALAKDCDALLLPGSNIDVDPRYYGEKADHRTKLGAFDVFALDRYLIRAFENTGKKILGVCAGLQSLNVAFGGTLHQDIPGHWVENETAAHTVALTPGSTVQRLYGRSTVTVNSFHHQAVKDPAPGFLVSAVAPDGTIEAIEKDHILGVQWHPEIMKDHEFFARYFAIPRDC